MELLTQVLKDEEVRTCFGWAFLSTAVGLKTAVTSSAIGSQTVLSRLACRMVFETPHQILVQFSIKVSRY